MIDGYNLIGTRYSDLKAERDKLINALIQYHKTRGHTITVVFDGWGGMEGKEKREATGGIAVVYSRIGENADSVIKRMIADQSKKWIVVSSDREIVSFAWASSSVPIPSETFYQRVIQAQEGWNSGIGGAGGKDQEEKDLDSPMKGNARMLSKKKKEIQRVMKKL